ncbi:phage tail tape measure protein [Bilophila wadsworthia]|uniref:phage tail tape measure protein n=3 Tax=Bilophila wadsworthia TaxID=35833 RepID=UPI00266BFF1B|nr:phage tail tape measure protein [Bilophila wadsworthia]
MGTSFGVTFAVGAAVGASVASAFTTVSSRVKGLKSNLKDLQAVSQKSSALLKAQSEMQASKALLGSARMAGPVPKSILDRAETAQRSYRNAERAAKKYGVTVENVAKAQSETAAAIGRTEAALGRQQQMLANQAKRKEYHGQIMETVATAAAVVAPVKLAIDYESNWADLKKVANFAKDDDEKRIKQDIFSVSERTGLGPNEVTKIAAAAAEAGVANGADGNLDPEKMKRFLNDAAEMSVAYGITAEEAGERLATYQSRMELTAEQTRGMGDAMNYVASKMNATAADTSSVVARMGAVGKTAGLSEKSIVGLAAALVSTSENKETAGTAMKNFLLTLSQGNAMTKAQKETMKQLGFRNVGAIAEGMKKGGKEAENTLLTVLGAIKKMPEAEQAGIAKELFGTESLASLAPLINNPNKLREIFALANSEEATGSQLAEFKTRSETTQGALDRLAASGQILAITIGSVLLPPLASAAEHVTSVIKPVRALAEAFPGVTRGVMFVGIALVGLKVSALAGGYAATILSDGWQIAKGIFATLRPSVIAATVAQKAHAAVALASAAKTRVFTAALVVQKGVSAALAGGTALLTGAVRLLGLAFASNPIGFIIMSVITLGTAVYALSSKWEPLRIAVDKCTAWIGEKLQWVSGLFTPVLDKLKTVAQWMGIVDNGVEFHDESGVADDGYAAYPGMGDLPKRETSFWDDWFGSKTEPTQAAVQPPTIAEPFAGPTKPALSEAAAKPAQAKLPGQARTAPASSRIPEYAVSGEARRTPPPGNTASPSARQPVSLNFSMPVTLNGIPAADMGDALLRSIDSRAAAIEERIARMLGNIVGDQRRLAYGN